eukprot:gene25190-10826_t
MLASSLSQRGIPRSRAFGALDSHARQIRPYTSPRLVVTRGYANEGDRRADDVTQMVSNMKEHANSEMNTTLVSNMKERANSEMSNTLDRMKDSTTSFHANDNSVNGSGNIRIKLENAVKQMQEGLVERDTEVRLLMLAACCGEHILFIGPPGTAKSEIGRRLNKLISGTYFERLLTRFSVPEELFGPLSMRALEDDKYVRQTRGYLPEAEVAFIDEIFKANSAILNTLLTLVNERLFDNGSQRVKVHELPKPPVALVGCPLLSVVGASNELPESEELDALYDRFLVRREVKQVSAAGVAQMLTYYSNENKEWDNLGWDMKLTRDDIRQCKSEALRSVKVPPSVIQLVTDLRTYLQEKCEPSVYVSDRRLVKSVQMLQIAAYCNGRSSVTEYDALLLQHVLWQRPEQSMMGCSSRTCRFIGNPVKVGEIKDEVTQLRQLLVDRYVQVSQNLEGGFPAVLNNIWLGTDEAQAVATSLEPKLTKTKMSIETLMYDVILLEVALKSGCEAVALANLMPRYWADFIRNSDLSGSK